ncbi:MAG: flagellar biosynthesis protein FlhA [Pirellulales bacterium]
MTRVQRWPELILPLGVISAVLVLLVPLPAALLDLLLAGSLALSVIILLTTVYVRTPLEFSVFPTLLLASTVGRLVLNVASTRLILSQGATEGLEAAGAIIRGFGQFVTGDRLVVGLVLFTIIFVIQFIVITKGATRISEVAARFSLDGLPGRQTSIDADVHAGLIDHAEAQRRRGELTRQADFYSAMDGASKFVRGDAVAGVLITLVNIVGGLVLGMTEGGMTLSESADVFTRLTIGDGLVSQIPALLVSLAAGLLTTRGGERSDLPRELLGQLFTHPRVLAISGIFLALLVGTQLPKLPLLVLGGGCLGLAVLGKRRASSAAETPPAAPGQRATPATAPGAAGTRPAASRPREERVEDYLAVDPLEIELGMRLLRLADPARGGDLLRRVTQVRQQVAAEIGMVLPKVRIRDNLRLEERSYQLRLAHNPVAQGTLYPERLLAIDAGGSTAPLTGEETWDPVSQHPAYWIPSSAQERAVALGYEVQDAVSVLAAHLHAVVRQHADELLTRDAVKHLLEELRKTSPAVVDELIPHHLRLADVQQVLRLLLREEVPIRQLGLILETLGDYAPRAQDPAVLVEHVRQRLARTISARYRDRDQRLQVVALDPALEDRLTAGVLEGSRLGAPRWQPTWVESLCDALAVETQKLLRQQRPPVVLVSPPVRAAVKQLTSARLPRLVVLSYQEITRDTRIESAGIVADPLALPATPGLVATGLTS